MLLVVIGSLLNRVAAACWKVPDSLGIENTGAVGDLRLQVVTWWRVSFRYSGKLILIQNLIDSQQSKSNNNSLFQNETSLTCNRSTALTSHCTLEPSLTTVPSTRKWYNSLSWSTHTKCSLIQDCKQRNKQTNQNNETSKSHIQWSCQHFAYSLSIPHTILMF